MTKVLQSFGAYSVYCLCFQIEGLFYMMASDFVQSANCQDLAEAGHFENVKHIFITHLFGSPMLL